MFFPFHFIIKQIFQLAPRLFHAGDMLDFLFRLRDKLTQQLHIQPAE